MSQAITVWCDELFCRLALSWWWWLTPPHAQHVRQELPLSSPDPKSLLCPPGSELPWLSGEEAEMNEQPRATESGFLVANPSSGLGAVGNAAAYRNAKILILCTLERFTLTRLHKDEIDANAIQTMSALKGHD